ncbi:MAG TPA: leucine-rich repeat domain-containing protein [Paludibacteraceae bacterium]|nr:leucine-rich repeat domain-containing protein [Paludibacteraceae bacterium]
MKKLQFIFAAAALLVLSLGMTGCDPTNPNNPEMPAIVSISETNSDYGIVVEVVYKNNTRMFFLLTSPNTCELTSYYTFYKSEGYEQYNYSGELVIPETITHKGVIYTVTGIFSLGAIDPATKVWIPKTVINHGLSDLSDFTWRVTEINVSPDNPVYSSVDGVLFNKDKTELLDFPKCSKSVSYTIPNGVRRIEAYAFYKSVTLSTITMPNSVTYIGDYAFYECSGLTTFQIPNSVTEIGGGAFSECSSILSVNIPEGVTVINKFLFFWCTSLNSLTIPSTVTLVDQKAFYACYSLTTLTCLATTPPATFSSIYDWEGTTFSHSHIQTIKVPAGSVSAYRAAEGWRDFTIVAL